MERARVIKTESGISRWALPKNLPPLIVFMGQFPSDLAVLIKLAHCEGVMRCCYVIYRFVGYGTASLRM